METNVYTQPKLPYAPDALAPIISAETISYHWGKHEKTYITTPRRHGIIFSTSFRLILTEVENPPATLPKLSNVISAHLRNLNACLKKPV